MISSVKPAASRSKLERVPLKILERHDGDLRAVRARRARRSSRRCSAIGARRCSASIPVVTTSASAAATHTVRAPSQVARWRAAGALGSVAAGLGFAAGIARFDRIAAARQLDLHPIRGPFARVVLGQSLPQPQRFDADERIGLRVEIGRAAEHADGDRVALEPLRSSGQRLRRRRSAGSPRRGPRARSTGCAGCARAPLAPPLPSVPRQAPPCLSVCFAITCPSRARRLRRAPRSFLYAIAGSTRL